MFCTPVFRVIPGAFAPARGHEAAPDSTAQTTRDGKHTGPGAAGAADGALLGRGAPGPGLLPRSSGGVGAAFPSPDGPDPQREWKFLATHRAHSGEGRNLHDLQAAALV